MNKSSWKYIDATEYCLNVTDGTHDTPKIKDIGKHLITSKHIKGRNIDFEHAYLISDEDYVSINQRSKVDQWDVLISMIGEYCGYCYVERNEKINYAVKNVGIFKTGSKLNAEWLYYYLNSAEGKNSLLSRKSGSSQPYITLGSLRALPILVPGSENEKQKITNILSLLDSKIELNNRINSELEAIAKTLFDYWFVQFDFPDANGKPYKTSGGKMILNKALNREIPEGWIVKSFGEIADLKAGGDKPKNYSEIQTVTHQIPIFSNGISNDGLYGFTDEAKILKPSITVSARGTIGYCVLRNKPFVPIIRLIVVTPNSSYELKYLYEKIKSMYFDNSGSVQQQLTVPQISDVKVIMPSSEILKKYDVMTSSGIKKIELNKEENQQLTSLRDWLLPMLMNGQVKVEDSAENKANYKLEEDMRMASKPGKC